MAATKRDGEKDDKPKMTPQEAAMAILEYLRKTNRPYSPTEVSGNLKIGLTLAKKLLKDMHERQEIACAASGKQQVYHVVQDEIAEDHSQKLEAANAETARLQDEVDTLRAEEKDLRTSLRDSAVKIPLPQLKAEAESKEKEKFELQLRLKGLKGGNLKPVDPAERERITKSYGRVKKAATERKKIRANVWKLLVDANESVNVEELKEQLGLEF